MRYSHIQQMMRHGSHRRAGMLASTEITVVVVMLVVLCWAASCLVPLLDGDQTELAALSRACSDRPVHRIMMEETGNRLWVLRPHELTAINLASKQIDRSRDSVGGLLSKAAHSRDGSTSLMVTHDNLLLLEREGLDPVWLRLPERCISPVDPAVSADGSVALIASSNGTIFGWNLVGASVASFEYRIPHRRPLTRICLDGNGMRLLAAFDDGVADIHDVLTGKLLHVLLSRGDKCVVAIWSDDGNQIAMAFADGTIGLIDAATDQPTWKASRNFRRDLARVTALAMSPDGRWLAASGLSTKCIAWDVTGPDTVRKLSGHDGLIRSIAFSAHAKTFFTGSLDGTIREWSLESFTTLAKFQ